MKTKQLLGTLVATCWLGCAEKKPEVLDSNEGAGETKPDTKVPEEETPKVVSKPPTKFTVPPFMARSRMNKDLQKMKQVAIALRVYAAENEGAYPDSLDAILSEVEQPATWLDVSDEREEESSRILYVKGLTDVSSGELPLLVHPYVILGKRVVIYCDGRGIPEDAATFTMPDSLKTGK